MKENLLCKTCGTTLTSETATKFCSAKCANSHPDTRQKMTEARNQKLANDKLTAINDPMLSNQEFIKILELGVSKPQAWEPFLIKHKALSTFLSHKKYEDEIPSETLYRLQNNITERPMCECGENRIQFRKGKDGGYVGFCSTSCSALLKHNKTKASETCLAHFGVTHQLKSKDVQAQIKQTCLERHGVEHPLQSPGIMNKRDAMFGHLEGLDMTGDIKKQFDSLHFDKIELSDEVLVLNVDNYIGESTRNEIEHAKKLGKHIRYLQY